MQEPFSAAETVWAARRRRSVLFLPASNPRAIDKARASAVDVAVLDLEDAVAPEAKDAAREQAVRAVRDGGFGGEVLIRVNGVDTPWFEDDFAAVTASGADGVVVPKINDGATIGFLDGRMAGAPRGMKLWAMIETAQALLNLAGIAAAAGSTRLAALVVGTNDLSKELRSRRRPDRAPLQFALAQTVATARAYGLLAIDGVYNDFADQAGLEAECEQGRDFGFDGKSLIHPGQIEACNRIFSPSEAELAWARKVVEAFAAPEAEGKGAIRVEGGMAERLHLAQAKALLGEG